MQDLPALISMEPRDTAAVPTALQREAAILPRWLQRTFLCGSSLTSIRAMMGKKWADTKYIPYFQAHTNTYAPLSVLKEKFEEALTFPNVVGLAIATRADCISDGVADYLGELAKRTYLEVELGLQSVHDVTGERINRCHSYADFLEGYQKLVDRGIFVCVHIINGLPGEDREMMLQTARTLSHLKLHSVKIHLLHVLKGTVNGKAAC